MAKSRNPAAQGGIGAAGPGRRRSGQGAGTAYAEMLRRQAQKPRHGSPGAPAEPPREVRRSERKRSV